jgi:imidazoleglycerol-phosphate dehydratase / histidinol-phosphatase
MKKKILFIDRDGTLIWEPPGDFRVNSLEKFRFLPGMLTYLRKIATEFDYELVLVTNQDGLGTPEFPEETFWPLQDLLMKTMAGEKIMFYEVCIDRSTEENPQPTRKPGTGMLTHYFSEGWDLKNSFVIGDRITDVKLAMNLGAKAIFIRNYDSSEGWEDKIAANVGSWEEIYAFLEKVG